MILVFGKSGQVATELAALPDTQCFGRDAADLTDPASSAALILQHAPSAVINAAAYTAVDKAEEDEDTAHLVNAQAPAAMARVCAEMGIPFVHISTDYVFDGSGTALWQPTDPVAPLGAYGRTKLAGEQAVSDSKGIFGILRTSWVFSAHGNNFVKTMLRLGASRDALTIVADQIGGPTAARDIAQTCHVMALQLAEDATKSGVYHFAGAPTLSWADFARAIFAKAGLDVAVTDIPSKDYPTPAARPANSRMDCTTTTQAFGVPPCDWDAALDAVLEQLKDTSA
ncbi:dTDP-4-dehydrorhamnose reductase [Algirhabdus cladophorae]|uniref:dTDP-4-dehydrorhamnose reductase n=1 Tax=Algirhabdus cladophorae TaxID=3377108 RepID=UPI003B84B660